MYILKIILIACAVCFGALATTQQPSTDDIVTPQTQPTPQIPIGANNLRVPHIPTLQDDENILVQPSGRVITCRTKILCCSQALEPIFGMGARVTIGVGGSLGAIGALLESFTIGVNELPLWMQNNFFINLHMYSLPVGLVIGGTGAVFYGIQRALGYSSLSLQRWLQDVDRFQRRHHSS